jgi:hypothetical protein
MIGGIEKETPMPKDTTNVAAAQTVTLDGRLSVSIEQLCEMTSLGRTHLYGEIRAGRLKTKKFGRRTVCMAEDIRRWLAGKSAENEAA